MAEVKAEKEFIEQKDINREDQTIFNDPLFSQRSSQPDSARPFVASIHLQSESAPFFEEGNRSSNDINQSRDGLPLQQVSRCSPKLLA